MIIAIPALSLLFLQNRQVQTMVSKLVAERLSEELQATITISSVNYSFFKRIQVNDLYIEDLHGDTLIYSALTKLRIKQLKPGRNGIEIKKITVENAYANFVIDSSNVLNLSFIVDRLKNPHLPPEKKIRLHIGEIEMIDGRFSLTRMIQTPSSTAVNFNDLDLHDLQISLKDLVSSMDTVQMHITSLRGVEKSGFKITGADTHLTTGKTMLHFRDLDLTTDESHLQVPYLGFDFVRWDRFQDFPKEVDLTFRSDQSLITIADLSYFVPGTRGLLKQLVISGNVHGQLNDLKGEDLYVTFDQNSSLAFDFVMIGLPEFNNTFMDFRFRELNSSVSAMHALMAEVKAAEGAAPNPWSNLGNIDFKGHFTGYPDHFVAAGYLGTDMGKMIMDLSFLPDTIRGVDFYGHLTSADFHLGEFLNRRELVGQLDMNAMVKGNLDKGEIQANLDGIIDTLEFSGYTYSNITMDGEITNKMFNGGFRISDPNIKMDFLGKMDFSGDTPEYIFTADVARARPYFLKLGEKEPNSFASFLIKTDLKGSTLDELDGDIQLVNSLFSRKESQLQLYDVNISARNHHDSSSIRITSEMFDATMDGNYRMTDLPASFRSLADELLNTEQGRELAPDSMNRFSFSLDFKKMKPLLDFFYPVLGIGDNSHINGIYDPAGQSVAATGFFTDFTFARNRWSHMDLLAAIEEGELQLRTESDSMTFSSNYSLVNHRMELLTKHDTAYLDIQWDNHIDPAFSGEISANGSFQTDSLANRGFLIDIHPTLMFINGEPWDIHPSSLLLRKDFLHVDSLAVTSREKFLMANGTISSAADQAFTFNVNNLHLDGLAMFTPINAELEGNITGTVMFQRKDSVPYIFSDLVVDTLVFNQQKMGTTSLNAAWNESGRAINMQLISDMNDKRIIEVDGTYSPQNRVLDFDIHMNGIELQTLGLYTGTMVSDLEGTGNMNMTLDGTLENPQLNGTIEMVNGAATLAFLNTHYFFNDEIRIYNNNLYLNNFIISDEQGNRARIDGSLSNHYLKDFSTNIRIETSNLMCLNTTSKDNDVFYGSVFATGNARISGKPKALKLTIEATTGSNTNIYLPLYNAREVQSSDFITFINEYDREDNSKEDIKRQVGGLEMDLKVNITEEAVVQMIFDPKVGDIIKTSGKGNLQILLSQGQGFRMFGDVELLKGDYLFTLQNVINKKFKIEPGGKIRFNGSPTSATVDLAAIYSTRTTPYNLYPGIPDEPDKYKRRIPVECHLALKGDLQSPSIITGIEMPTAEPEIRDLLENATSTEEELMKQFLSLLVINNFYSVSGFDMGTVNSNIAGVTASELFSNQLSNWLSQISDDFDVGFNYRPGDQVTSQEVEVALSTQLLNDRVIITGNVDVGGQETNPSPGSSDNPYIMGDFEVEYKVTDNVSVFAFNRARDELLFETAPYKQGVGVSYREEFNNLRQLWDRYLTGLTSRKKKKKKSEASEPEE